MKPQKLLNAAKKNGYYYNYYPRLADKEEAGETCYYKENNSTCFPFFIIK